MQEVRDFGKYPKEGSQPAERQLAKRVRSARKAGKFTPEEETELDAMKASSASSAFSAALMQEVRDLGKYPQEVSPDLYQLISYPTFGQ